MCQTIGPGMPSTASPWSFSKVITAAWVMRVQPPGRQSACSCVGVSGKRHVNEPAGALSAACSWARAVAGTGAPAAFQASGR